MILGAFEMPTIAIAVSCKPLEVAFGDQYSKQFDYMAPPFGIRWAALHHMLHGPYKNIHPHLHVHNSIIYLLDTFTNKNKSIHNLPDKYWGW